MLHPRVFDLLLGGYPEVAEYGVTRDAELLSNA